MKTILLSEIPFEDLVKELSIAQNQKLLLDIEKLITRLVDVKEVNREITRKEVSLLLNVSPPTVDKYTAEGLLVKYGVGKRARYLAHEVEAAKDEIMKSLHKSRELQPYRRLRTSRHK